jgi:U3 small nucleolar ribonucleoprotein protein IMP4
MIKKNIRLRKEYLYNKSKELHDKQQTDKKQKVKAALDNDKAFPTEFRREKDNLLKQTSLDDDNTIGMGK